MKKNVTDMPESWHRDHRVTGLPDGEVDWCRDVGVSPEAPSPERLNKARELLEDLNLVGSMVSDLAISIRTFLADPNLPRNQVELCKRMEVILSRASEQMKDAGRIAFEYKLFQKEGKGEE